MMNYPDNFPVPLLAPYQYVVDMGLVQSSLGQPLRRQRRRYKTMINHFQLEFALPIDEYAIWQAWINDFGYNWFNIRLTTYKGKCIKQGTRIVSNMEVGPISDNVMVVSLVAESMPVEADL